MSGTRSRGADTTPSRPSIPAVLWFAVAVWLGVMVSEAVWWAAYTGQTRSAAGVAAVGALAVVACVVARRRLPTSLFLAAGLVAGAALGGLHAWSWQRDSASVRDAGACTWRGSVVGDPEEGAYGLSVRVKLAGGIGDGWVARVGWPASAPEPTMGDRVRFRAVLAPADPQVRWARSHARAGVAGGGVAWTAEVEGPAGGVTGVALSARRAVRARLAGVSGPGGDLMSGVLLGDRRRVAPTPLADDFRALGLSHLLAVSGDHLALACVAAGAVLGAAGAPRRVRLAGTLVAGLAFAVLTGVQISAIRAAGMLAAGTAAAAGGRRADPLSALAVCLVVLIAERPWCVFDIGLQLSALAVGGLALYGALATAWVGQATGGVRRLAGPIAMTLVAQAVTAPVTLPLFGMVSLAAPLANAVIVPLVSCGLVLGLCAAGAGSLIPGMATGAMKLASAPLAAAASFASLASRAPGAAVPISMSPPLAWGAALSAAVGAWVLWPRPSRGSARRAAALGVALTVAFAVGAPAAGMSVTVLDVGQGDAILVRDGLGSLLVDAGPDRSTLMKALGRTGVRRLDAVVLTHLHDDHTGGLSGLAGVVGVGWLGLPSTAETGGAEALRGLLGDVTDRPVRLLSAGQRWRVGRTDVEVLWPEPDKVPENTNSTSVVLHLRRGALDVVLTGDAEGDVQRAIVESGRSGRVEVLKVPHHGSDNGLVAEGLALWDPTVAVISVGEDNRFDHPDAGVIEMLAASGVTVLRTDECGDVTIEAVRGAMRVRTQQRVSSAGRCERIRENPHAVIVSSSRPGGVRGRRGPQGSQVRLPRLGLGGAVGRRVRGPPEGQGLRGGRPRLQPARVRR